MAMEEEMRNEETQNQEEGRQLQPDKVERVDMPQVGDIEISPDLSRGQVLVVKVDEEGKELGSGFVIQEKTYERVYKPLGFVIKKKAK